MSELVLGLEEQLRTLFQPDSLLSFQYLSTVRRKYPIQPEKRLMLAVLEDAVACYQKNAGSYAQKQRDLFRAAESWILAHEHDWPFSFEQICEVLGFDPDFVREGLKLWREAHIADGRHAARRRHVRKRRKKPSSVIRQPRTIAHP